MLNETVYQIDPPLPSNAYGTIAFAWISVIFSIIGCSVVLHKAYVDPTKLRYCCMVMGLLTITFGVANVLRISSTIPKISYFILKEILMILFANLMVAITFNLGSKFHIAGHVTRNLLYWATLGTTALMNILVITACSMEYGSPLLNEGNVIDIIARAWWPIAVFFTYWWAFDPLIKLRTGVKGMPSSIVVVGIW